MARLRTLKSKTIETETFGLLNKVLYSVPFQMILFAGSVLRVAAFRAEPINQVLFAVLVFGGLLRIALKLAGRRLVARYGIGALRLALIFVTTLAALSWGLTSAHLIAKYGLTFDTFIVVLSVLGSAASVVNFNFDLVLVLNLLILIMSPMILAAVFSQSTDLRLFSGFAALYLTYLWSITVNAHRTKSRALGAFEDLEDNEQALKKALDEVGAKHKMIATMLASIDQAYLIFGRDGVCGSDPSRKSEELFGFDPAFCKIEDVLEGADFAPADLRDWYKALFSAQMPFADIAVHGPKLLRAAKTGRTLRLRYHPWQGGSRNEIEAVVVTATDATREIDVESRLLDERERAGMILRVNERRAGFRPFLNEFELLLLQMIEWAGDDFTTLREHLHNARVLAVHYGLESLARKIDATEVSFASVNSMELLATVRTHGHALQSYLAQWRKRELGLLAQLGLYDEDVMEVSKRKWTRIGERLVANPEHQRLFQNISAEIRTDELGNVLKNFQLHVAGLATKTGKQVLFRVEPLFDPIYLPVGAYREALRSLIHLFSYQVESAIESAEERRLIGKAEAGTIHVHYGWNSGQDLKCVRIVIADDGRAVDLERLRRTLSAQGRPISAQATDGELALHIFDRELSLVTSGLAELKAAVEKSFGRVAVTSTGPRGTTYEIVLPDHDIHHGCDLSFTRELGVDARHDMLSV